MNTLIFVLVLGIIFALLFKKNREYLVETCSGAVEQTVRKNANKVKILNLLAEKGELSNHDIRQAFGFAERTVVRYMEELEKADQVVQVGNTGRDVVYRIK